MKKRWIVLVVIAAVAALLYVRFGRDRASSRRPSTATASAATGGAAAGARGRDAGPRAFDDPRTKPRASIAGTVRVKGGGPLAGAMVCTTWSGTGLDSAATREPACTTTDATGAYRLAELIPAWHSLSASAPRHIPGRWRDPVTEDSSIELDAGEQRTGVDFALAPGGVEVSGVVEDVSGGPVDGALVQVGGDWWSDAGTAFTRADAQGKFTLWTAPGEIELEASAEGYADGRATSVAPTRQALVLLTPESVLAGIVIEAGTKTPVAGAIVSVGGDWRSDGDAPGSGSSARTDAAGRFRLTRLRPGRYKPTARAKGAYGEPTESVLLGLGQAVDDVVIEVHAAATVRGRIVIAGAAGAKPVPCARGWVSLRDAAAGRDAVDRPDDDGQIELAAVLPGHYEVDVRCDDQLARDRYPAVDVTSADVDGLVWEVGPGGTLRGVVRTSDGKPVAGANVSAQTTGGGARSQRGWSSDRTDDQGKFEMRGLVIGDYAVSVYAEQERTPDPRPKATIKEGAPTELEIVLEAGGSIAGSVVDGDGQPVAGVDVRVANDGWNNDSARSGDDGTFLLEKVRPGERRVVASRGWWSALKRPGSSDDDVQGEKVMVAAGKTATVRLVVESRAGVIHGKVSDSAGQPVVDAWVIATRESERAGAAAGEAARESRWSWGRDDRPVITGTDGAFTVRDLSPGTYTVRAYRRGGGEAVAEHVALGTTASLVIRDTASISGTVATAGGAPPDEVSIGITDEKTGFSRRERFFRTGGVFALRDLPAGTFVVSADAASARAMTTLTLAHGEQKQGVRLVLEGKVRLRGRLVELGKGTPVPGLKVSANPVKGSDGPAFILGQGGGDKEDVSGEDGRFVVAQAPTGKIYVNAFPLDFRESPFGFGAKILVVPGGVTEHDVGDIEVARRRVKPGDAEGDLGFTLAEGDPDQEPEEYEMKVAHVRPGGPAAAAGMVAGDVIVAVDGHDSRGTAATVVWPLMDVPPGAKITFGLARGDTVTITAGPPL